VTKLVQGFINLPQKTKKPLVILSMPVKREPPSQIFDLGQSCRCPEISAPTKTEQFFSTQGVTFEGK
jgi:hypothetical protein